MRSFDWREEQNDAGVVPTNESPRACALVGSCWNSLRIAQSVDYQLDFRCAWRSAERSGDTSSQVDRASSLRDEWIGKHQPVLNNPAEASALLDQLKEVAGKYDIQIENPVIGSGETTPYHQTVFASIETKSPWPPLVHFLYDVQRPDAFIVFENVNLAIDGSDPTMMRGKFKVARWFAPTQKTK
jgi:hypothetical protein